MTSAKDETKVISSKNLPDVEPENQSGNYDTTFDQFYKDAGDEWGVPFALIKAHAIRESSQNATAYHYDNPKSGASYGLLQVEWVKGSNRFASWGYGDDKISDGSPLYDCSLNCELGTRIMKDNLNRFSSLRDAVNAYNTGVAEKIRVAPANYVNDVLKYYSKILGRDLS